MLSTCPELTPRAPIPDGRMAQYMQPCTLLTLLTLLTWLSLLTWFTLLAWFKMLTWLALLTLLTLLTLLIDTDCTVYSIDTA